MKKLRIFRILLSLGMAVIYFLALGGLSLWAAKLPVFAATPAWLAALGGTSLAGIGRKSANVVLGNAFGIPGFPVDTHVRRVLNRLGATKSQDPEVIEREVCSEISPELWTNFSHLIIQHGRKVCSAAKPRCSECVLSGICAQKGVGKK